MKAQAGWKAQACRASEAVIASVGGFEKFVEDTDFSQEPC